MDNNLINEVLKHDSLASSEKILGKSYKDFNEDEQKFSLAQAMLENKVKENILKESKDTYFTIPWNDFINLLEKQGFKLQQEWTYNSFNEKNSAVVYKNEGMLIIATATSNNKMLNSGTLYTELELKNDINWGDLKTFQSGGFYDVERKHLYSSYDVREGLINHINEIKEKATILPLFETNRNYLWFATHEDEKKITDHNGYNDLRIKRIKESTDEVKALCSKYIDEPFILKENTYLDSDIKYVNLTGNIKAIESGVFKNCKNLLEINIESDVKTPLDMIQNCPNLQKLTVHGVDIPLQNGIIKDNSLTGIIEGFKKEADDSKEFINSLLDKKDRLSKSLENKRLDNKLNMGINVMKLEEEIQNGATDYALKVDGLFNIKDFGFGLMISDDNGNEISNDKLFDLLDDLVEKINEGEIPECKIRFKHKSYQTFCIDDKEAKLISQSIDEIDKKLSELGVDISEKQLDR